MCVHRASQNFWRISTQTIFGGENIGGLGTYLYRREIKIKQNIGLTKLWRISHQPPYLPIKLSTATV